MRLGRAVHALGRLSVALALGAAVFVSSSPVAAAGTVTACANDSQFSSRLSGGGTVTFNCGHKTIALSSFKNISHTTVIDGGGRITLSGGSAHQLFHVAASVSLTLKNIVLKDGKSSGNGGAILNAGTLHLDHVRITGSAASSTGNGGAIYSTGDLTAKHSTFDHDTAGSGGGAILAFDNTTATIGSSSFDHDQALATDSSGGAISTGEGVTLHVNGSRFTYDNADGYGGAIQNSYQSTAITVTGSYFNFDAVNLAGGAVYSAGSLTLNSSTFDTNGGSHGGAVWSDGVLNANNVTAWRNVADRGGAFYLSQNASGTFVNVTMSANTAGAPNVSGNGGNIFQVNGGTLLMYSTLSANAYQSDNCTFHGAVSAYGSLSTDATCNFVGSGRNNVAVPLGEPDTNGGPVPTIRLTKGSLAIDDGDSGACPTADARGVTRPKGGGCDVGAFEYQPCSGKPAVPTALKADAGPPAPSYQRVFLDWVGSDCTSTYKVVVTDDVNGTTVYDSAHGLHESSHTTGPLVTGYSWRWRVTACNAKGCTVGPWRTFRTVTG